MAKLHFKSKEKMPDIVKETIMRTVGILKCEFKPDDALCSDGYHYAIIGPREKLAEFQGYLAKEENFQNEIED